MSGPTCDHQRSLFPSYLQSKVITFDSDRINRQLEIGEVDDHAYRVTQGHAAAWELLHEDNVRSVLIFEDDYRAVSSVQLFENPSVLRSLERVVNSSEWKLMRFGYSPSIVSPVGPCPRVCTCEQMRASDQVCVVTLPSGEDESHCDVR
ncbi:MAG: hypothetical protein SGPRY_007271 [Prymnesium sp.]